MQAAARYEGGYSGDHPTVRAFWEVMHGLPLDQKRRFLAFATGSDRRAHLVADACSLATALFGRLCIEVGSPQLPC